MEPVVVEFAYQAPKEVCAPAAVLEDLPQTGSQRYALDASLSTDDRWMRSYCDCQPPELLHGDRDLLLEDHVLVSATITVFQERSDSSWAADYPDLPVGSEDLDDWAVAVLYAAERLPTNVQTLNVAVFRELVLAEVDRRAKREAK